MIITRKYHCKIKILDLLLIMQLLIKSVVDILCRDFNPDYSYFLFHVFHIFNLIIQNGLKHISEHVNRIGNTLIFITISPSS